MTGGKKVREIQECQEQEKSEAQGEEVWGVEKACKMKPSLLKGPGYFICGIHWKMKMYSLCPISRKKMSLKDAEIENFIFRSIFYLYNSHSMATS